MNKFVGIGRAGKDPEVKTFDNGSIATFSLALSERGYTLQNGTQVPERTDWFNVVVRGGLVKVAELVKKGSLIAVRGKLRTRSYDKDGQKVYVTEIHADKLELLGKKEGSDNSEHPYTQGDPHGNAEPSDDLPF